MATAQTDIAFLEITYSGGDKELESVESVDFETEDGTEVVKTMNRRRRARGFTSGVATFPVTLNVVPETIPEVDWEALHRTREVFQLAYEDGENGTRYNLLDCRIMSITDSRNADGKPRKAIRIQALDKLAE